MERSARKPVVVLLAACALVAALALWLTRDRSATDALGIERELASTDVATPAPIDVAVERAKERALVAVDATRDTDEATTASALAPITGPRVEVLVVDAATDAPVAGADVRWANQAQMSSRDRRRPRQYQDAEELLFDSGLRTTTDADGRAWIGADVVPGRVSARSGDAFGWTWATESADAPLRIEIRPDAPLVVEVVDAEGRPVGGVPVGARVTPTQTLKGCFWRATTDAQTGRARLRSLGPATRSETVYVCIEILAVDAPVVAIDLADPPSEPVRLVLPACGSVTVDVRDASGRGVVADKVGLALAPANWTGKAVWGEVYFESDALEGSSAHFPFVGVGLEIHAHASVAGRDTDAVGRGPRARGETARFALDIGPPLVVVTARLVDESGRPLASRWVQSSIVTETKSIGGQSRSWPMQTDGDGRVEETLRAEAGRAMRATLSWRPIVGNLDAPSVASAKLDVESPPPLVDLGDVTARVLGRIAAGRVVDDLGSPVEKSSIHVDSWTTEPAGMNAACSARRTSDGGFEVLGEEPIVAVRVRGTSPQGVGPMQDVLVGDLDARVVVPRPSEIGGTVLLDAGVAPSLVEIRLTYVDGLARGAEPQFLRAKVDDGGAFRFSNVAAGRIDLEFRAHGGKAPVHVLAGVDLPPGARAIDARLDAVDLRGKIAAPAPVPSTRIGK